MSLAQSAFKKRTDNLRAGPAWILKLIWIASPFRLVSVALSADRSRGTFVRTSTRGYALVSVWFFRRVGIFVKLLGILNKLHLNCSGTRKPQGILWSEHGRDKVQPTRPKQRRIMTITDPSIKKKTQAKHPMPACGVLCDRRVPQPRLRSAARTSLRF